jgi:hypothetical protein
VLFEPCCIELVWPGRDLTAADLFGDIVRQIRTAQMCPFDNRGTLNRPNVYIEIGIAFVLRRPMIVCEYVGRGPRTLGLDTGNVPSDLSGLLPHYEDLCRQLYLKFRLFLRRHRL